MKAASEISHLQDENQLGVWFNELFNKLKCVTV